MTRDPGPLVDAASLGEVAWLDDAGTPRAAGVLPLVRRGVPVLALTFDRTALAVELAAASTVDLLLREPRNTGSAWCPGGWRCRSRLVEDLDGDVYVAELHVQELRRYPPARRWADSPLLMREHWWYLPRLLVELEPMAPLPEPDARADADDLLLVTARDDEPVTGGARASGGSLTPDWGPAPATGEGVVLGQDATFPDLERWDTWTRPVQVDGQQVAAVDPLPDRTPPGMPGLAARWRAERRFAARCRAGIADWRP